MSYLRLLNSSCNTTIMSDIFPNIKRIKVFICPALIIYMYTYVLYNITLKSQKSQNPHIIKTKSKQNNKNKNKTNTDVWFKSVNPKLQHNNMVRYIPQYKTDKRGQMPYADHPWREGWNHWRLSWNAAIPILP